MQLMNDLTLLQLNYRELSQMYLELQEKGLEIFAFPCNDFGAQEPGTNDEIQEFAHNSGATFPVFGKLDCERAEMTHPFYTFLKTSTDGESLNWNFAKFLCNAEGLPIKRYGPRESPRSFEADLVKLIGEGLL